MIKSVGGRGTHNTCYSRLVYLILYRKLLDNFEEIKRQFSEVSERFFTYIYTNVFVCITLCTLHVHVCHPYIEISCVCFNTATMNHYMLLLCMITGIHMGWPCMEKATTILLISFVYSLCVKWLHAANTCCTYFGECCSMCILVSMSM